MDDQKKPIPAWAKLVAAVALGSAATTGGQRLATDSPVHFAVDGEKPAGADAEWDCQPEGGIIGAPMVCRPKPAAAAGTSTSTKTE